MHLIKFIYNPKLLCRHIIMEVANELSIVIETMYDGQIQFSKDTDKEKITSLEKALKSYHIKLLSNEGNTLTNQIKDCVRMIIADRDLRKKKLSTTLSELLGYSYSHLSSIFSTETFSSIENFYINVKIEKAKELLAYGNNTVSEVAHELDYSSRSHLSQQFKNVTGLTVTQFQKLVKIRESQNQSKLNING